MGHHELFLTTDYTIWFLEKYHRQFADSRCSRTWILASELCPTVRRTVETAADNVYIYIYIYIYIHTLYIHMHLSLSLYIYIQLYMYMYMHSHGLPSILYDASGLFHTVVSYGNTCCCQTLVVNIYCSNHVQTNMQQCKCLKRLTCTCQAATISTFTHISYRIYPEFVLPIVESHEAPWASEQVTLVTRS